MVTNHEGNTATYNYNLLSFITITLTWQHIIRKTDKVFYLLNKLLTSQEVGLKTEKVTTPRITKRKVTEFTKICPQNDSVYKTIFFLHVYKTKVFSTRLCICKTIVLYLPICEQNNLSFHMGIYKTSFCTRVRNERLVHILMRVQNNRFVHKVYTKRSFSPHLSVHKAIVLCTLYMQIVSFVHILLCTK